MSVLFSLNGIRLRLVESSDLSAISSLRNDYSTWSQLGDPRPVKPGLQARWLDSVNSSADKMYFIAEDAPEVMAGLVRMDEYDLMHRSIRVGTDVVCARRGKGLGKRIFATILKYCFHHLGVHRVWLAVLSTNHVAKKLYRATGFKTEGRYREAVFRDGKWVDYVLMSILESEYKP
jgi:RimJ/RimL family protein N-acetyltransferase